MKAKRLASLIGVYALLMAVSSCGGQSAQAAKTPRASGHVERDSDEPASEETGDSYCADGTCFRCGSTFCLKGWYCDETQRVSVDANQNSKSGAGESTKAGGKANSGGANTGGACSWIPECVSSAGCSCVSDALGSSCRCEERDQGTFVTCS